MISLQPGSTFAGYRIVRQIARGGMGTVYEAVMIRTGRPVALKCIAGDRAEDSNYRDRFMREADTLMKLVSPRIVPLYDWGEEAGILYLALAFIDGPTLAQVLAKDGPLSLPRTIELLAPVAEALDSAHRHGYIHRDVKPANILLDNDGNVWLSDFGLSKLVESTTLTIAGTVMGTLGFMSPEQFSGKPLAPGLASRTDIYAFGCVLHACLTGAEPFPGESFERVMHDHLQTPPPQLTASRPDLPTALDAIEAKALAKEPIARWPTAGAFLEAVRGTAARQSAEAIPPRQTVRRPLDEAIRESRVVGSDQQLADSPRQSLAHAVADAIGGRWRSGRRGTVVVGAIGALVALAAIGATMRFGLVPALPADAPLIFANDPPPRGQTWVFGMETAMAWIPEPIRDGCTHQDPPDLGDIGNAMTELKGCETAPILGSAESGISADYWFFESEQAARSAYGSLLARFGIAPDAGSSCAARGFENQWHHGAEGGRVLCVIGPSSSSSSEPQLYWTAFGQPVVMRLSGADLTRLDQAWNGGLDARPPSGTPPSAPPGSMSSAMP
jgi:hypothetical protein